MPLFALAVVVLLFAGCIQCSLVESNVVESRSRRRDARRYVARLQLHHVNCVVVGRAARVFRAETPFFLFHISVEPTISILITIPADNPASIWYR